MVHYRVLLSVIWILLVVQLIKAGDDQDCDPILAVYCPEREAHTCLQCLANRRSDLISAGCTLGEAEQYCGFSASPTPYAPPTTFPTPDRPTKFPTTSPTSLAPTSKILPTPVLDPAISTHPNTSSKPRPLFSAKKKHSVAQIQDLINRIYQSEGLEPAYRALKKALVKAPSRQPIQINMPSATNATSSSSIHSGQHVKPQISSPSPVHMPTLQPTPVVTVDDSESRIPKLSAQELKQEAEREKLEAEKKVKAKARARARAKAIYSKWQTHLQSTEKKQAMQLGGLCASLSTYFLFCFILLFFLQSINFAK